MGGGAVGGRILVVDLVADEVQQIVQIVIVVCFHLGQNPFVVEIFIGVMGLFGGPVGYTIEVVLVAIALELYAERVDSDGDLGVSAVAREETLGFGVVHGLGVLVEPGAFIVHEDRQTFFVRIGVLGFGRAGLVLIALVVIVVIKTDDGQGPAVGSGAVRAAAGATVEQRHADVKPLEITGRVGDFSRGVDGVGDLLPLGFLAGLLVDAIADSVDTEAGGKCQDQGQSEEFFLDFHGDTLQVFISVLGRHVLE